MHKCKQCKKEFEKKHGLEKYCSKKCRLTWLIEDRKKTDKEKRIFARKNLSVVMGKCAFCKKEYQQNRYLGLRKYCSIKCSERAVKEKQPGYIAQRKEREKRLRERLPGAKRVIVGSNLRSR